MEYLNCDNCDGDGWIERGLHDYTCSLCGGSGIDYDSCGISALRTLEKEYVKKPRILSRIHGVIERKQQNLSVSDLELLLQEAIDAEQYETAATIRDLIRTKTNL